MALYQGYFYFVLTLKLDIIFYISFKIVKALFCWLHASKHLCSVAVDNNLFLLLLCVICLFSLKSFGIFSVTFQNFTFFISKCVFINLCDPVCPLKWKYWQPIPPLFILLLMFLSWNFCFKYVDILFLHVYLVATLLCFLSHNFFILGVRGMLCSIDP